MLLSDKASLVQSPSKKKQQQQKLTPPGSVQGTEVHSEMQQKIKNQDQRVTIHIKYGQECKEKALRCLGKPRIHVCAYMHFCNE